jgi:hypothetical protein
MVVQEKQKPETMRKEDLSRPSLNDLYHARIALGLMAEYTGWDRVEQQLMAIRSMESVAKREGLDVVTVADVYDVYPDDPR